VGRGRNQVQGFEAGADVFGLLYRLLIFVLLVWLAKTVFAVVVRMFGPGSGPTRIHRDRPGPPAPPEKKGPPKEDIIDVTYTEVDSKKKRGQEE
jgi:hypothetical protein